jgi:hypothetical protein
MPNINERTLVMAIQAVDYKIASLEREIDAVPPDAGADLELLLLNYSNAAEDLRRAYQEAMRESDNLPPYEKLVRN